MKVRRVTKKVIGFVLSLIMVFSFSTTAFAAESEDQQVQQDEREFLVVNGEDIVYVGEDYENPFTGEYIHWNKTRGTDKSFSFEIRYSITSSSFTVHSTKVKVSASASIVDLAGNTVSGFSGHKYTVSICGWYNRNLQFAVGGTQSGTVSGLENGGSYKVQITNNDYLNSNRNLSGSGTIKTA